MKKIFFVIDTQRYEQLYLLEYPFTEETFDYLKSKYVSESKSSFIRKQKDIPTQDKLKQLFLTNRTQCLNFFYDIMIQGIHYISYPVGFVKNQSGIDQVGQVASYEDEDEIEESKEEKDGEVERTSLNINEKNTYTSKKFSRYDRHDIKMFNLVCAFDKKQTLFPNSRIVNNTYIHLEVYCKYFSNEEYNKKYLSLELIHIMKFYESFFDKKNFDCTFSKFMTLLPTKTNLYKILNYLYEVINENEITSFKMNDLDVKYYILDNHEENVKEYHSLIIVKPGAVKQIFMHSFNSNPTLLVFVNRISPFKTLYEMSKDNKISVKSILKFVNALESSKLVKKIFRIQNHSTFVANPKFTKIDDSYFNPFTIEELIKPFYDNPPSPIESVYEKHFIDNIDKDKFLKMLVYMLEKEYIIQTSQIVIPNFELKYEYPDFQTNIINELQSIFKEKDHSQKENTIIQANEERKEGNNEIYFEDGLEQVKQLNIKDYEVLQYILPLLHKKLFIEEIAYLSGYKFMKLHEIFEKYPWLFTVIYINLNNEY